VDECKPLVYGMAKAAPAMARIQAQQRAAERVKMIEMHRRRQAGAQAGHQHFE
jgi:hypothetical protein